MIGLVSVFVVTLYVQREAPFKQEALSAGGKGKALILYHPSRDAHFADDLTEAIARGFADAGLAVDRWTMTGGTPAKPEGYDVIAVVSNTFFWRPDWPTMRYLGRADFKNQPVIGIMAGAGSTVQSQAKLSEALRKTGADLRSVRSLWIARPNDPARLDDDNRVVAAGIARKLAEQLGRAIRKPVETQAPVTVRAPKGIPRGAEALARKVHL